MAELKDRLRADLTGYSIAAVDGDIGRIDRATYERASYLVIDTGPWAPTGPHLGIGDSDPNLLGLTGRCR